MCHILCARKDTRERKGEARRANVIIMPSKQRKKKRMKTSLAAFDDDESDEHEKNDARDDATDADDALCPGPKKLKSTPKKLPGLLARMLAECHRCLASA